MPHFQKENKEMTNLLILLIQFFLYQKPLREALIAHMKLNDTYNEGQLEEELDTMIEAFRGDPLLIPFWLMAHYPNGLPHEIEWILFEHGNRNCERDVRGIYYADIQLKLLHQPEFREATIANLAEEGVERNVLDLLHSDFDYFTMSSLERKKLSEKYHINLNKLREAAGF